MGRAPRRRSARVRAPTPARRPASPVPGPLSHRLSPRRGFGQARAAGRVERPNVSNWPSRLRSPSARPVSVRRQARAASRRYPPTGNPSVIISLNTTRRMSLCRQRRVRLFNPAAVPRVTPPRNSMSSGAPGRVPGSSTRSRGRRTGTRLRFRVPSGEPGRGPARSAKSTSFSPAATTQTAAIRPQLAAVFVRFRDGSAQDDGMTPAKPDRQRRYRRQRRVSEEHHGGATQWCLRLALVPLRREHRDARVAGNFVAMSRPTRLAPGPRANQSCRGCRIGSV